MQSSIFPSNHAYAGIFQRVIDYTSHVLFMNWLLVNRKTKNIGYQIYVKRLQKHISN